MNFRRFAQSLHVSGRPGKALLVMPFALIAAVTAVDVSVPPDVHMGPFLVAAPAVTASFAGPRMTALVGAVAVLAQTLVAVIRTSLTDLNHTYQIIALFLISVLVTLFAHVRERNASRMTQLRAVAEAAQRVVMRPLPVRSGPLRTASIYLAAAAEAQLGGDLFARARTASGTRLIIGDVRGKGLDAIGEAASVLGAFRALAHQGSSLPGLVEQLEQGVAGHRADMAAGDGGEEAESTAEGFVTAAVLDIPDAGDGLSLINCGHPPPLVLRDGRITSLNVREPAPPLGLAHLLVTRFTPEPFRFGVGDLLLLYTDGVIEARNAAGDFYPLLERLAARRGDTPDSLLTYLCADLLRHAGGSLGDDVAMVALERLPAEERAGREHV
ncbi:MULTISPECIES: PP2C family protein-serine/threonine phosphatase [unclassified Streptomyces]|uniref:PP2C family protein-serine/threonine phosphatase n=2 Tax=Streptomyces TaxID=1883 RepID=UPI0022598E54|nr:MULTISPECIES: PP2C family protein-serine/threonine phosphatase [unclassified Streptomyces]MCX5144888.1 serine/threonine-protein phosphatase [Streptomyces sp. NBC_00338]WRZ62855.1 serine/threonine-protein phosphatase [Streptomyces sp. NBC_01257]WSU56822.1 serine/threonine-protein phosphatase [Streptomyces sp. NBC_01104]